MSGSQARHQILVAGFSYGSLVNNVVAARNRHLKDDLRPGNRRQCRRASMELSLSLTSKGLPSSRRYIS